MPLANYCRKCKAEVSTGESCPYCGGKLAQTGERVSFGETRLPVKDWFAWNNLLRVVLPVLGLTTAIALVAEAIANGTAGVVALIRQGFMGTMLAILAAALLLMLLALCLQGRENVHYILDKDGVRELTYVAAPTKAQLYARFVSSQAVQRLQSGEDTLPELTLVKRVFVGWAEIRRVRIWRENLTLLYYRPSCWLALAMRCPISDLPLAEAYTRKKVKRFKKTSMFPELKKEANV